MEFTFWNAQSWIQKERAKIKGKKTQLVKTTVQQRPMSAHLPVMVKAAKGQGPGSGSQGKASGWLQTQPADVGRSAVGFGNVI